MQPITKEETLAYTNSTSLKAKSVGPNSLLTKLFKLVSGILCKLISIVFKSFRKKTFSDVIKPRLSQCAKKDLRLTAPSIVS